MRNQEHMVAKMSKWVEEGDVDPLMLGQIMNVLGMWMFTNFSEFEATMSWVQWGCRWGSRGPQWTSMPSRQLRLGSVETSMHLLLHVLFAVGDMRFFFLAIFF